MLATETTALQAAQRLNALGYRVTPVEQRGKKAVLTSWSNTLLPISEFADHFGSDQNIGILLGPMAGGIVDIDLDHPIAVELAPANLPETSAKFGRASARASHWMYRVSGPVVSRRVTAPQGGPLGGATLLELRAGSKKGTCQQTVGPGSIHQGTGELIEWEPRADGVAAVIELSELLAAFEALAAACLARIGGLDQAEMPNGGLDSLAGCNDAREETAKRYRNPAPVVPRCPLSSPVRGTVFASVDDLLQACIPAGPGHRRECLFRLARGLKFNLGCGDHPEQAMLINVFSRWMRLARSKTSGDTPEDESLLDFLTGYDRALTPVGVSATVAEAIELLDFYGLPAEAEMFAAVDEKLARLVGVCWAKQMLVGEFPFTLSASECALAYFSGSFERAEAGSDESNRMRVKGDRLRKQLADLGLLACIDRGRRGRPRQGAARFRYIGPSAPYPFELPRDQREMAS